MAKKPKKTGYYQDFRALDELLQKFDLKYDWTVARYYYHHISTKTRSKFSHRFSPHRNSDHSFKLLNLLLEKNPGAKIHLHCEANRYSLDIIHPDGTKVALSMEDKPNHAIFWGVCNYYGLDKSLYFVPYS